MNMRDRVLIMNYNSHGLDQKFLRQEGLEIQFRQAGHPMEPHQRHMSTVNQTSQVSNT